ncbi:MAG: glycosyltransferase family 39 protein [Bacteroidota bacterium]
MNNHFLQESRLVPLFFLFLLAIGLWIVPDYGISWDEDIQRKHGRVAWDYVSEKWNLDWEKLEPEESFRIYKYNFHGTLFQMTCFWIQRQLGLEDYRDITLLRHYSVFLLFFLSSIFFYKTLKFRFRSWQLALLGTAMLVLSPRIFGNAFFNTKDLILLPCYIISIYTLLRFLQAKNGKWAIWHAIACALVINARLMGVIVPFLTILFFLIDLFHQRKRFRAVHLLSLALFLLLASAFSIALWPYLWENPIHNFLAAFELLSKYNWGGNMLYFNTWINAQEVPWHYSLAWIHLSTPLVYLIFFWVGFYQIWKQLFRRIFSRSFAFYNSPNQLYDLVLLALCVGPIFIVVWRASVIYDSWRHLFFIYPALLFVAIRGFVRASNYFKNKQRSLVQHLPKIILLLSMSLTLVYMLCNHPYQHTYMTMPDDDLERRFEIDYWGVAYQTALRTLIERENKEKIKVRSANYPGDANARLLPKDIRDRIELVWDVKQADYYITNYRYEQEINRYKKNLFPLEKEREFLVIRSWNTKVIGVYDVRE